VLHRLNPFGKVGLGKSSAILAQGRARQRYLAPGLKRRRVRPGRHAGQPQPTAIRRLGLPFVASAVRHATWSATLGFSAHLDRTMTLPLTHKPLSTLQPLLPQARALPLRAAFCSLLLLCASAAPAAEQASVETVDGRKRESLLIRNPAAQATVVFENGSRATLDGWGKVLDAVSPHATVFAYNRPGYANSEATDAPRDGATIVEELRASLRRKGLAPPYVLVGHSLGGLYMQLFARRYPEEVKGLVLVDALYPRVVKKPGDFPFLTRAGKWLFFSNTVREEIDRIHETGEMVAALPGIDDKPIIRLVNRPLSSTAIPVDFGAFNVDEGTRAYVRALYPKAKTVVADASHQMQVTHPEIVAAAIREILEARRLGSAP